jgi:hypothetical protein
MLLQDGAKGYDIIEFCFLRPEFHEVRPRHPRCLLLTRLTLRCRWSGRARSTGKHLRRRDVDMLRALTHRRPGVPFMNPNMAAALGGGRGSAGDDDDDD